MLFRRKGSHPPELRGQARELRRAGFSYGEILTELEHKISQTMLQGWVSDIVLTAEQRKEIERRQYPHLPEIRERARELRREGLTYPEIIAELGGQVAQGTLSSWVSDIELTTEQKARIKQKELEGSAKGRPFAIAWNRRQKAERLQVAQDEATPHSKRLSHDREALQLLAAGLYIGEGAKSENALSFCNSDPKVVKTWITLLRKTFVIDETKLRCQVGFSEGMNEKELKEFWSKATNIPLEQFNASAIKKKAGQKRREGYKGVCAVIYHSSAIRRYLDALAQGVIDEILEDASREI